MEIKISIHAKIAKFLAKHAPHLIQTEKVVYLVQIKVVTKTVVLVWPV